MGDTEQDSRIRTPNRSKRRDRDTERGEEVRNEEARTFLLSGLSPVHWAKKSIIG